jgi:hypothetical protein
MINKKSLMQMGGVPTEQNVDPAMEQIVGFISSSINEGQDPSEVIMDLLQQEVDQQIIGQALMQVGYQEEDVIALFDKIQKESQPAPESTPQEQTQNPQELARNQAMEEQAETEEQEAMVAEQDAMAQQLQAKSGIEIKPENEGKFTKWATARNMSVQEAANKVMSNRGRYPASVVKMANFAKNAAGWKKEEGGDVSNYTEGVRQREGSYNPPNRKYTLDPRFKKEGGEFEPHFMYKGERKIRAKDMATHLRLKERGYDHEAPKAQDGKSIQKRDKLTYSPNYANPNAFEMGDAFNPLKAVNTLATGVSKLFGGKDRDGDGNKDGVFRDSRRKKAERKLNKGNYYDYDIEVDKNDPNSYAGDKLDLYNASKLINKDELRTTDQYNKDVEENSRVNYNTETGKYDKFISSRGPEEYEYRNAFDFVTGKDKRTLLDNETYKNASKGERLSYFTNADEGTRQEILDFGEAKKNGMPEGTTLSIDPVTGETSYMSPEADNPNEYDTMMGYNTYGKGNLNQPATTPSMIPTGTNGQPLAAMNNTPPRVPQLSFKEWTMQSPMNRMGANAQQQYQDYLAGKQTTPANSYGKASTPNLVNQAGNFIKDKYNQAAPFIKQGVDAVEDGVENSIDYLEGKSKDAIEFFENKFPPIEDIYKYGGDLPKAQAGTSTGSGMGGMWFDQLDLENQMNTDFGLDTQAVANSQLQQQNPALGNTPLQNQQAIYGSGPGSGMGSMFLDQQAFQKQLNALNQNAVPAQTNVPTQPGYDDPKVKRTNKLEGGLNRFMDSKPVQAFAGVSEFAVNAADSVNDWFRSRDRISAERDNRNQFGLADNIYGTNEDPFNKRGMWNTNKNEAGSEGDRTTGLYMSQKGGEVQVDNDILAALIAAGADIEML